MTFRRPARTALASLVAVSCAGGGSLAGSFDFPELEIDPPEIEVPFRVPPSATYLPGDPGEPALWRAEGEEGSLYLLGLIDAASALPRPSALEEPAARAYARAEELVVEVHPSEVGATRTLAAAGHHGLLEPPATLEAVVSAETWRRLSRALEAEGRSVEAVEAMQPWLASLVISEEWLEPGGAPPVGADAPARDEKRVVALATPESRLRALASLPLSAQERLLREALAPRAEEPLDPASLLAAWRRGEADALVPLLAPPDAEIALVYEHLVHRPSEAMAARLHALAGDGAERLVAVSLLHLVGERGIPALLAGRGYRVERVD